MDVRGNRNPVLVSARRWLAGANARNPWNHNEHFHRWILRNLPARRRAAMDVGCGTGMLAGRLAPQFAGVIGIDADVNVSQTYDCFSAAASFALCDVRIDRLGPVHDGRRARRIAMGPDPRSAEPPRGRRGRPPQHNKKDSAMAVIDVYATAGTFTDKHQRHGGDRSSVGPHPDRIQCDQRAGGHRRPPAGPAGAASGPYTATFVPDLARCMRQKRVISARVAMDSYAERPGVRRVMPGHRTAENTSAVRPEDPGLCSAPLSRFIDRTISLVWAL
jgi:hypothetical protein